MHHHRTFFPWMYYNEVRDVTDKTAQLTKKKKLTKIVFLCLFVTLYRRGNPLLVPCLLRSLWWHPLSARACGRAFRWTYERQLWYDVNCFMLPSLMIWFPSESLFHVIGGVVQLNAPKSCLFLNKRFSISSVGSSESWCRPPPGSQAPGGGGPEEAEGGGPAGGSGVQKIEGTPPQRPLHPPPLPHKPPPPKLANNITTTATNHQPPCNVLELAPPTPTLSS